MADRRGIWWFKMLMKTESDLAVNQLMKDYGAYGLGTFLGALFVIYRYANDRIVPTSSQLVQDVAHDLHEDEGTVREVCDEMASLGLLDPEMWDEGKAMNDHASEFIDSYWKKSDASILGNATRWGKKS